MASHARSREAMAERLRSKLKPQYGKSFTYLKTCEVPSGNMLYEGVTILDKFIGVNEWGATSFPRGTKFERCIVNKEDAKFLFVKGTRTYRGTKCDCCDNLLFA